MRFTRHALAIISVLLLACAAQAQDASHCDKLTDDDAFNKCLAAASPSRAGARPATAPLAGTSSARPDSPSAETQGRRPARGGRSTTRNSYGLLQRTQEGAGQTRAGATRWRVQRMSNGRVRMTIPVNRRR